MRLLIFVFFYSIAIGSDASDSLGIKRVLEIRDSASAKLDDGAPIEAETLFKNALSLAHSYKISTEFIDSEVLLRLQNCYLTIGDNRRAREIQESLVTHAKASENNRNLIYALNDLAVSYANELNFEKAYSVYKEYILLVTKDEDRIDGLDGLSATSIRLGFLDEALVYLNECERLLKYGQSRFKKEQYVFYNFNKASYFLKVNDKNRAEEYLLKVVNDKLAQGYRKSVLSRLELAKIYFQNQKYKASMKQLTLAKFFFEKAGGQSIVKDPLVVEINYYIAKILLMRGEHIEALPFVSESNKVTAFVESQYLFNEAKFQLNEYNHHNLALGVQISFELFRKTNDPKHLIQALIFADQAKSNVLNERLSVNATLNNGISREAKELRFKWVYQLNEYKSSGNTEMAIQLRNSLDSLDRALGLRKKKVFDKESIMALQQNLAEGQLVIEHFIHDESLYIFSITRDDISVTKKAFANSEDVLRFYKMLQNPNSSVAEYAKLGSTLYEKLLPENMSANQSITIIPDGVLYYLPFDALPTVSNNNLGWSTLSYLGNSHTTSYDFSLQTLAQKNQQNYEVSYTGFAPRFDDNPELTYLTNGLAAVQQGKSALGGSVYENVNATTGNLRNFGCNTRVLQLYTHAVSSDSSYDASYIYLADKKMYVDEILTLPLQTDLCLLTACEVGLGKEYGGEGVTGVAWAFKAAGAHNVVQSLWRINEESSSFISERLFVYLADNVSSKAALQQAKQDYLANENVSERLKHPYYWAGMSHYGQGARVQQQNSRTFWYGFGLLGFGLVALFGLKKLRQ